MPRMSGAEYADDLTQRVHELSRRADEEVRPGTIPRTPRPGPRRLRRPQPRGLPDRGTHRKPCHPEHPGAPPRRSASTRTGRHRRVPRGIAFVIALLADTTFDS